MESDNPKCNLNIDVPPGKELPLIRLTFIFGNLLGSCTTLICFHGDGMVHPNLIHNWKAPFQRYGEKACGFPEAWQFHSVATDPENRWLQP